MKKTLFIVSTIVTIFFSCKHTPTIITEPTVTITPPNAPIGHPSYFINGDTVQILVDFSDEDELTDATVLLKYNSPTTGNDTNVFYFEPPVNGLKSYTLDTSWVVTGIITGRDASLIGTATNKGNLTTTTELLVTLIPF